MQQRSSQERNSAVSVLRFPPVVSSDVSACGDRSSELPAAQLAVEPTGGPAPEPSEPRINQPGTTLSGKYRKSLLAAVGNAAAAQEFDSVVEKEAPGR